MGQKTGVSITSCCVPAEASLLEFKNSVQAQLGAEAAVYNLLYRGCQPGDVGIMQDWADDRDQAPRFQASCKLLIFNVHVKVAEGQDLQLSVRCCPFLCKHRH